MAVDTPATIAILGAGPVGLETALYARYLGYDVMMFEQGKTIAANVRRWGHVRMFSHFEHLRSPLGLAAINAQDLLYEPPAPDARLTGHVWVDAYLAPLSRTDLLADCINCCATVRGVSRQHFLKTQPLDEARADDEFHILVQRDDGRETLETADIVIDTTGVYNQPNWCGPGGLAARGERCLRSRIEYHLPDILGHQRTDYEARNTLVVGNGLSAAETIVALAQLIKQVPATNATWVTRSSANQDPTTITHDVSLPETKTPSFDDGPISTQSFRDDLARRELAEAANACVQTANSRLRYCPGATIEAIDYDPAKEVFLVTFDGESEPRSFDRIIANVGYRNDSTIFDELQVRVSERTGSVGGIADHLTRRAAGEGPESSVERAQSLLTTEPHFYVLGAKSYGRDSSFCMADGFQQIRDLFSIIGDRPDLDLYATAQI